MYIKHAAVENVSQFAKHFHMVYEVLEEREKETSPWEIDKAVRIETVLF